MYNESFRAEGASSTEPQSVDGVLARLSGPRFLVKEFELGNLHFIDWAIIVVSIVGLRFVSLSTRKFMKGVADFLSANRSAGRYLLTISQSMGEIGVVSFIAAGEAARTNGFTGVWWGLLSGGITGIVIPLTGWIFYRFRETRAMTTAQFFEARYSRKFRIYAGITCWVSGVLNFGVFPGVAAHFFVYYCGLPAYYHPIPGLDSFQMSSFATVMFIDMVLALSFVTMGGQITVMITECLQGIFCAVMMVVVCAVIMIHINWSQIEHVLSQAPAGQSMLNPFDTTANKDFSLWYYLIGLFGAFYTYQSWQGSQGFFSSARNPHEQKMGAIIGVWRRIPTGLLLILMPVAALVVMKLPEYSNLAQSASLAVSNIPGDTKGMIEGQMIMPVALAKFLPYGIKGLLATIMLFLSFTCHDTYMHSWGSIFVQDVLLPIRNKPLDPEAHIRWLRRSVIFVAAFGFVWSLFWPAKEPIYFWFAMTGTIWLAGSGPVIIGGLYWRRGTTAGAYAALALGLPMAVLTFIAIRTDWSKWLTDLFSNAQYVWGGSMVLSGIIYVVVSLLTGQERYNVERLLHRGKYAIQSDHVESDRRVSLIGRLFGITKEFSLGDRILAVLLVVWTLAWFLFALVFMLLYGMGKVPESMWGSFWHFWIWLQLGISVPVCVWFTIGGVMDMRLLFRSLSVTARDTRDDGTVVKVDGEAEVVPESPEPSTPTSAAP